MIPESVTHLEYGNSYCRPFVAGSLPASITHLKLGDSWLNVGLTGIPSTVAHITLSDRCSKGGRSAAMLDFRVCWCDGRPIKCSDTSGFVFDDDRLDKYGDLGHGDPARRYRDYGGYESYDDYWYQQDVLFVSATSQTATGIIQFLCLFSANSGYTVCLLMITSNVWSLRSGCL